MPKPSKNSHIRRMLTIESKYGLEGSLFDIQEADRKGWIKCSVCGSRSYFKPTVGTYVCSCGKVGKA